jgi:hypothetical protein
MQFRVRLILPLGIFLAFIAGCSKPEAPKTSPYMMTSTLRDIMKSMVMPSADVIWNSVSTAVTDKGVEEKAPKTEQEWQEVRNHAVTVLEASDLILMPGRRAASAGATAEDPKVQLTPEQIEKLIKDDPDSWTKFAHELHESLLPAIKAIDEKNAMALGDAGGAIDKACENCHLKYWYPNEAKK